MGMIRIKREFIKMGKVGKKFLNAKKAFEGKEDVSLDEANLVNNASAKFDETIDIPINAASIKTYDQMVRGVCALPHGNGKVVQWLYLLRVEG